MDNRRSVFWSQVDNSSEDDCWIWFGPRGNHGYGVFGWNNKSSTAHRFAYEHSFGEIKPSSIICHHCDNPLCVNPIHLFAGTYQDNVDDMIKKDRQNWSGFGTRNQDGEKNCMVKLTEEQVKDIRSARKSGVMLKDLAKKYHVHPPAISRVCNGKRWRHLA